MHLTAVNQSRLDYRYQQIGGSGTICGSAMYGLSQEHGMSLSALVGGDILKFSKVCRL